MLNLKKVVAVQADGDWYVIPVEMKDEFSRLSELAEVSENYDEQEEFNEKFGQYATGGDLNIIQLYAEI